MKAESEGVTADLGANADGGRKVSTRDIQLVQNLIERCLQLYMSQREVVSTLHAQAEIEPGFTGLVWQVRPASYLSICHRHRQSLACSAMIQSSHPRLSVPVPR